MTPAAWPLVPLSTVLVQHQEYIDAPESRAYPKLSVKLYGKGVTLDAPADGATLKMQRHQLARAGQVILSEIWGKKGAIGLVPPEGEGALCTSHFFLFDIVRERLDPRYLQFVFTANYLEDQLGEHAKGTTGYAAVRPKHLLAASIPLPPLPEQRRIVARIEALAAKVDEARRLRQVTDSESGAFVTSVHLSLSRENTASLGDIMDLDEQREPVIAGGRYPQVGVRGFGQGLFAKADLNGRDTTYKALNRLYDGAVVLSQVKGWEGAIGVCGPDLAGRFVSPEYRTFACKPKRAVPEYLSAVFATPWFWSQLQNVTRGMGGRRERTRPEQFLRVEIPIPTIEMQRTALASFAKVDTLKRLQAESAVELDALLPAVLDRAFRGEL